MECKDFQTWWSAVDGLRKAQKAEVRTILAGHPAGEAPLAAFEFGIGDEMTTIIPGLFRSPMVDGLPAKMQASLGAVIPYPARLGLPSDYARLAARIVENVYLNGETIRLDSATRMPPR